MHQLYHSNCGCATHEPVQLADGDKPFDEAFIKKVFKGELKDGEIYPDYYFNVAKKLTEAVTKGLGGSQFKATDYRNTLKAHLEHNVFAFSAAKSLAALEQYRSKLTTDKGEVATYAQFRTEVTAVDVEFNDNHLKTEYGNAIATAQMADKWEKLQQHEYLEYRTVGDNRVRRAHKDLDKKVFRTNDPIWDKIYPPNDWNCRCTVIPAKQGAKSDDPAEVNAKEIKPYFKRNAGKTKVIYSDEHPYFKSMTAKGISSSELKATTNYNMRSINSIYTNIADLPAAKPMKGQQAAEKWFNTQSTKGKIAVETKDGLSVDLDENFFKKIIASSNPEYASRSVYAHKAPEVMEKPDEVWSKFHRGQLQTTYIKYYQDKPYMVAVKENNGKMEFETFFKIDRDGQIDNLRSGVLKYRK